MSDELLKQPIVWVDTDSDLENICETLAQKQLIAIDTEFMRSNTYYPIAGLIQVNDGAVNYLIDPTTISDFAPLSDILVDDNIVKAIHSGSEDVDVFYHSLGFLPSRLFDTQVAGAILGIGFSVGFANMVEHTCGIELPKTQTRSDWLQRPLSVAQKKYAAMDVEYLYALAEHFLELLAEKDRLEWAFVEGKQLIKNFSHQLIPGEKYLRHKFAYKLNRKQLGVFQLACEWRELNAQERNKPRNHIIKDHALFDFALLMPAHISQLRDINGFTEKFIKYNGKKMIDLVDQIKDTPHEKLPPLIEKPLSSRELSQLKRVKVHINEFAASQDISPEILIKKKEYEACVRHFLTTGELSFPPGFLQWRADLIREPLFNALKQECAS